MAPRRKPSLWAVDMGGHLSSGLPWLKASGNRIVSADTDRAVILRGINRSGLEYAEPHGCRFVEAAGISAAEIQEITQTWRANVVRLPFNQDWALNGRGLRTAGDYLDDLDRVIGWCSTAGAYALLDLHWLDAETVFGLNSDGSLNRVPPLPTLRSLDVWTIIATRYRNEPAVLYDIFNEPHDNIPGSPSDALRGIREDGSTFGLESSRVTMAEWKPWARQIVRAIRGVHARAPVFVGGIDWGYDLRGMPLTVSERSLEAFPDIVYSTHVYPWKTPLVGWTPGSLLAVRRSWDRAFGNLAAQAPVFVGEWGGYKQHLAWGEALVRYAGERGIGWAAWSWSDRPRLRMASNGGPTPFGTLVRRHLIADA